MMENLIIAGESKSEIYKSLIPQIKSLIEDECDSTANLANISAALKEAFGFWWVGFYIVRQDNNLHGSSLVLGPFQGPIACTRIAYGKGVCGTSWKESKTIIVPDVEQFPGHIACSSLSRSEIVVPVIREGNVAAVLDIDSSELNTFDDTDRHYLEELMSFVVLR